MYSQDPKARRRRVKARYFTYGFMTLMTVFLTMLGVFYVLGYRIDKSFEIQRGGLAKFDSRPQEAEVAVDGQLINTTPYQVNLPIGPHVISYTRNGYQGWQKTIDMRPGEVLWLNYARLIPESITTSVIKELPALYDTATSLNREWYVLQESPERPKFITMDVRDETNIKEDNFVLPPAVITEPAGKEKSLFKIIAWNRSSDFMLVRHQFGKKAEFIRVPIDDPAESDNISRQFVFTVKSLEFSSNNPDVFFALDMNRVLYRIDINDPVNPTKIADNVSVFEGLDDNQVAFVATAEVAEANAKAGKEEKDPTRSLQVWDRRNGKTETLSTVPGDVPTHLSFNPYLTHDYLAVTTGNAMTVIQDPISPSKKTILSDALDFTPGDLSPSPGNRFFVAQKADKLFVYDVELMRGMPGSAPRETRQPLQWADDHHIALLGGGNLRLSEFDSVNTQFITSVSGPHDIVIGREGESLLSIAKNSAGRPIVQQSWLLIEADR